jgi:hypothetical protein
VILFGSLARGDVTLGSDLDIIAIMPASLSSHEWTRKVYAEVDREIACDILADSETDWQEMLPTRRFVRHALKDQRVLYEAGSTPRVGTGEGDAGNGPQPASRGIRMTSSVEDTGDVGGTPSPGGTIRFNARMVCGPE